MATDYIEQRGFQRPRWLATVIVLVLGLGVGFVIGRLTATRAPAATAAGAPGPTTSAPASPPTQADRDRMVAVANAGISGMPSRPDVIMTVRGAVLSWPGSSGQDAHEFTNRSDTALPPGTYDLTTFCAGAGQVAAWLLVGGSLGYQVIACSAAGQESTVTVTSIGGPYEVSVTAITGFAAVSFALTPRVLAMVGG